VKIPFRTKLLAAAIGLAVAGAASAQLIYGNTFPFWNVNGPLVVTGNTTLTGGTNTITGTTTIGAGATLTSPTITGATLTTAALTSPAITTSITTPSTTFGLVDSVATTINFGSAATTMAIGAATGTVTIGPAVVGSIATDATTPTTGAWKTAGGLGVAKALWVGGLANVAGVTTLANATDTTTASAGGTVVSGGLGVVKNIVGGAQFILTTSATPAAADACTAGRIVWGADYLYVCTASGAWKRAALTGGY